LAGNSKNKRTRIIVNPVAGAGKSARRWLDVSDRLKSRDFPFEHRFTEAPGHAVELAMEAYADSCETVVAVGGDGTVHEVVNGLHNAGGLDDITLGIIGTGTGGDYLRGLGMSRNYDDACSRLISAQSRRVDLGLVEYGKNGRRCFINFAGIGFAAAVARAANGRFKVFGATFSYLLGLLSTFAVYRNRPVSMKFDGEAEERKVCTVIAGIGRYGGGGMMTTPDAELDDGLFDVLVVGDLGKLELLRALPTIYKGTHLSHPKVTVKRVRRLEVTSGSFISLQADGELLGETPVVFSILPGALRLAV
jgi:diacylglycerol kinase (ATP)